MVRRKAVGRLFGVPAMIRSPSLGFEAPSVATAGLVALPILAISISGQAKNQLTIPTLEFTIRSS
jgi:hypothetical protein